MSRCLFSYIYSISRAVVVLFSNKTIFYWPQYSHRNSSSNKPTAAASSRRNIMGKQRTPVYSPAAAWLVNFVCIRFLFKKNNNNNKKKPFLPFVCYYYTNASLVYFIIRLTNDSESVKKIVRHYYCVCYL